MTTGTAEIQVHNGSAVLDGAGTLQSHFPFDEIRPTQQRALTAWQTILDKDKQFAVFELPTGAGKSGLSWAISAHASKWAYPEGEGQPQAGAYILTTQKSLQTQYLRDFENLGLVEMKGASNYRCKTHDTDCHTGALLNKTNKKTIEAAREGASPAELNELIRKHPTGCGSCPYTNAKNAFRHSPIGVTNFSYLLSVAKGSFYKKRAVLVIDEAHNCETQILSHVELEITTQRAEMVDAPKPPMIEVGDVAKARDYVLSQFMPRLKDKVRLLEDEIAAASDRTSRDKMAGRQAALDQFTKRIEFLQDTDSMDGWFAHTDERTGALKLRPLTAKQIADSTLFKMVHKLLFMSATILDGQAFIRGLGLDGKNGGVLRVDSDFPVENRLIHLTPAGSMSYKNVEDTIPKLVRRVEAILEKHPEEKGIIHTNSYKVTQAITDHLRTTKHKSRVLTHDSAFGSRDQAIFRHTHEEEPTVLISPSMTEGLDLKEDLCRFQALAKVPYPFLGDPFVKARMDYDAGWYQWQTALAIVQATGRGVRSSTDRAVTYLLDSDFDTFLDKADGILPGWWKKSVIRR